MLTARGITKSYGTLKVLKGIDLQVKEGEIISIVGASGAGKSTLLHILGTLDKPDDGSLFLNQEDLLRLTPRQVSRFRNTRVGFVFQFHNLLPEFTALENVCIPGYIMKNASQSVEKEGKNLLTLLGIQDRADHKPSQLSGGELQRAAVARALVNKPAIVFADEPSGNLDSRNANELHNLFFKLRDELNQTFVIVTHNEDLASMADRTLEIRDGMIVNVIKDH
jgi:lipoprotein-releasing system ATP-binding protein